MDGILLTNHLKSIRLVLSTALTRSGFLVKTSATTAGFWGLLNNDKFDIMITDVGLPDGDTLDALPKIQALNPKMKIIVISAKSTLDRFLLVTLDKTSKVIRDHALSATPDEFKILVDQGRKIKSLVNEIS